VNLYDTVDVRHKNVPHIHWLRFRYFKFINIRGFIKKVHVTQVLHAHWKAKVLTNFMQDKHTKQKVKFSLSMSLMRKLDGHQWVTSCLCHSNPRKRTWYSPGGPQSQYGSSGNKNYCPYQDSNPRPSSWWSRCYIDHTPWVPKIPPNPGHFSTWKETLHPMLGGPKRQFGLMQQI